MELALEYKQFVKYSDLMNPSSQNTMNNLCFDFLEIKETSYFT